VKNNKLKPPPHFRNQDQEVGIVNRAKEEAILMLDMQSELKAMTEEELFKSKKSVKKLLKQSGSEGGFGAKAQPKINKEKRTIFTGGPLDNHGYGAVIVEEGVVRINQVLNQETAVNLLEYINILLEQSQAEVAEGKALQAERFANVLVKKHRWDLLLPIYEPSGVIERALKELLQEDGPICQVIRSVLGQNAELYEWAALISDPGSDRQVIHPDIPYLSRDISILTCFISLQDIKADMGATIYLPKTQSAEHHARNDNKSERDELLKNTPHKLALLRTGDCAIYDPRVLHAGGSNESANNTRRVLCYFTFRNTNLPDPRLPNNPGSIREELKKRQITLPQLQNMLNSSQLK